MDLGYVPPSDDELWEARRAELMRESEKAAKPDRKPRDPKAKITYSAMGPDGVVHSKVSETLVYTHLLMIQPAAGQRWQYWGWAPTLERAEALERQARDRYPAVVCLELLATTE